MKPGKKLLLIMPHGRIHKFKFSFINTSFREAPLTLTTLAALVPKYLNFHITLIDESVQDIPYNNYFDIVGISCLTGTAVQAYEIAGHFRRKGSLIVLGGVHVTLMPEEAKEHADTIVVGFAEKTWPRLLIDYNENRLKKIYADTKGDINNLPVPRRNLQKRFGYMIGNTVFATRGCKGACSFCTVHAAKFGWSQRPVPQVVEEIRNIKARRFVFNDVHITQDTDYAKELLTSIIPLKKEWGGLASTSIVKDPELLDILAKSGCSYLLIGFETFNQMSLQSIAKNRNRTGLYRQLVDELHKRKITVQGCFIFGFDFDTREVFRSTLDLINTIRIDIPRYAILTPYPGTKIYDTLKKENRLLHENWYYYDTQHVVIKPKNLSAYELDEGFKWIYEQTFKINPIIHRTFIKGKNFLIPFLGNLAYNIYVRKLYKDKDRFPKSIEVDMIHKIEA